MCWWNSLTCSSHLASIAAWWQHCVAVPVSSIPLNFFIIHSIVFFCIINKQKCVVYYNTLMSHHTVLHVMFSMNHDQVLLFMTISNCRYIWACNYPVCEISLNLAIYSNSNCVSCLETKISKLWCEYKERINKNAWYSFCCCVWFCGMTAHLHRGHTGHKSCSLFSLAPSYVPCDGILECIPR